MLSSMLAALSGTALGEAAVAETAVETAAAVTEKIEAAEAVLNAPEIAAPGSGVFDEFLRFQQQAVAPQETAKLAEQAKAIERSGVRERMKEYLDDAVARQMDLEKALAETPESSSSLLRSHIEKKQESLLSDIAGVTERMETKHRVIPGMPGSFSRYMSGLTERAAELLKEAADNNYLEALTAGDSELAERLQKRVAMLDGMSKVSDVTGDYMSAASVIEYLSKHSPDNKH